MLNDEIHLELYIINQGQATADEVQIVFEREPRGGGHCDHTVWADKTAIYPCRAQAAKYPLHPCDKQAIGSWSLGVVQLETNVDVLAKQSALWRSGTEPLPYNGPGAQIQLRILARNQSPATFVVHFAQEEIIWRRSKTFSPIQD